MKKTIILVLIIAIALGGVLSVFMRSFESITKLERIGFGGELRREWTFDDPLEFTHTDAYYADGIKMAPKSLTYSTEGDFRFYFDYSAGASETKDAFAVFGYNDKYYFKDNSVFMIDVDVTLNDPDNLYYLQIVPDFRDDNYTLKTNKNGTLVHSSGYIFLKDTENYFPVGSSFHLTYIFESSGTGHIYANGRYVTSVSDIYGSGATYCDGFKLTIFYPLESPSGEAYAAVDNIQIHTFDADYAGAINELFDDPDIFLEDCSDTIFGR